MAGWLQDHCAQQEQQLAASSMELAQVQQARVQQAQQLAEIRQRAQLAASKEKGAIDKMEADLSSLRKEVEEGKERERQVSRLMYGAMTATMAYYS